MPRNVCFLTLELFGVTPLYFPANSWPVAALWTAGYSEINVFQRQIFSQGTAHRLSKPIKSVNPELVAYRTCGVHLDTPL